MSNYGHKQKKQTIAFKILASPLLARRKQFRVKRRAKQNDTFPFTSPSFTSPAQGTPSERGRPPR